MQIIRDMPFELGTLVYPIRPPELSMLVVAKATFDLVHEANAKIARPQRPLSGDTFFDDEADASPVYPSDFALHKNGGECFVVGSCHPPGKRATVSAAAFQVGPVQKAVGVFGDRRWQRKMLVTTMSEPESFESMPLRWDRAYGGAKVAANPIGRGADTSEHRPLPNLESMLDPIGGPDHRPAPVGFGPMAAHWADRRKLAGTYDERWRATRAPWLPIDMDASFFNQAPRDQRVPRHWAGNEDIVLKHVSPTRPLLRSRLPGLRVRAFVEHAQGAQLRELKMTLDTIVVDGDAGQALCVWRGLCPVADERASDIARLFAFHEPFDVQTSFHACRDRLHANLLLIQLEAAGFKPRNLQEDADAGTVALTKFAKKQALGDDDSVEGATMAFSRALESDPWKAPKLAASIEAPLEMPEQDRTGVVTEAEYQKAWSDIEAKMAEMNLPPDGERPPIPAMSELAAAMANAKQHGLDIDPDLFAGAPEAPQIDEATPPEPPAPPPIDPRLQVIDAHAAGRPIEGDFAGVDLRGLDLSGLVATGAHFARANFAGANLSKARMDGAMLFDASFEGATLTGASLSKADLSRSSLVGVIANGVVLDEAVLTGASLVGANLSEASLRAALLREVNFVSAVADKANLDGADFTGANLEDAKMRGASLIDVALHRAYAPRLDLRTSKLDNLRAEMANLTDADLRETSAKGIVLRGSELSFLRISFSKLEAADFTGCTMTKAALGGCTLKNALFVEAKLDQVEMQRSDLSHASFIGADLTNADLRGSCLYGAQAWNAKLAGVMLAQALVEGSSFAA